MNTIEYVDLSILCCCIYLFFLLKKRKYRLFVPSTIHTLTWLFVSLLIRISINGDIGSGADGYDGALWEYDLVVPFILGIVVSSFVGFSFAHLIRGRHRYIIPKQNSPSLVLVEDILKRFHWILYVCLILGIMHALFLYLAVGFENLGDYRLAAVTLERTGYGAFAQQFSGHATILGSFYIALLGYKHAYTGIDTKRVVLDTFLLSSTNIAIAGRLWIITALLPYCITFFWQYNLQRKRIDFDIFKVLLFIALFASSFSIIGITRNKEDGIRSNSAVEKFLYYTDGSRVMNLTLDRFKENSFSPEWGRCEFLNKWVSSPMQEKFKMMKSEDPGLSVTVSSTMPFLYFDFGYWGAFFAWAFYCFVVEYLSSKFRYKHSIFGILCFMELSKFFFQAPVGNIFVLELPILEWLIILYLLRKRLGLVPKETQRRETMKLAWYRPFFRRRKRLPF